jgi:response regulator RpfG family c-di-GMP phosphodiesterase
MQAMLKGEPKTRVYLPGTIAENCSVRVAGPLQELLSSSLVLAEDLEGLSTKEQADLANFSDVKTLLPRLVKHKLLTQYQADRIEAGKTSGLMLNNYRVLDRLGAGGMGVVFKAEHVRMRRPVAIKVLSLTAEKDSRMLQRFFAEMRAIAQLQHPNIVSAMDAGEARGPDADSLSRHYLVMEYVPGKDLEEYLIENGPMAPAKACDIVYQVASALAEAHKHHLVHRDIKPSNIRVTPEGQAKLLDFGLARPFGPRMTEPGTLLGTLDYVAPEQAADAHRADIRSDIYGLGGTLFTCLTARTPFAAEGNTAAVLARRLTAPPPSARLLQAEIPPELDAVVSRMLAVDPDRRYQTPADVMRALLPFIKTQSREWSTEEDRVAAGEAAALLEGTPFGVRQSRVLLVDDEPSVRKFCKLALAGQDALLEEAENGADALALVKSKPFDLVLLDVDMPAMKGTEVLTRLRASLPWPNLKILMFSGRVTSDEMAKLMLAGADDYISKPFSVVQLRARVKAALRLKEAHDRSDLANQRLLAVNAELEQNISGKDSDLIQARNALVLALAKLVESRDTETGAHLMRLQRYSRCLAEEASAATAFAGRIDANFTNMLECCAPLHDIGKVALPDHILLKPGKLTADERVLMQTHTIIGSDTLKEVARQHGFAQAFLHMAADIARHHHERYDGTGYPDRLAGEAIPLAARLVALGDVYDALRSRRVYKPALSHVTSMQLMVEGSPGHFDPALLQIFQRCAHLFERIFQELTD